MKEFIKKLARILLGEYSLYRIYASPTASSSAPTQSAGSTHQVEPIDAFELNSSTEQFAREQSGYAGPGSHAYACLDHDHIVGVCLYWHGARYLTRNFWPLQDGEAKLVQVIVQPEMRGRGIASALIEQSWRDMQSKGFVKSYARIWHSNDPSIRAFTHAGWSEISHVLEINPFRRSRPMRLSVDTKRPR